MQILVIGNRDRFELASKLLFEKAKKKEIKRGMIMSYTT
jgi:hypothetical protein